MAYRKISDYLSSGDVGTIVVSDNIIYKQADVPEAKGMFFRVGTGGATSLYRAPKQYSTQHDENTSYVILQDTETEICSITSTEELTTANGSYEFEWNVTNSTSVDKGYTIIFKVNGTAKFSKDFVVLADATNTPHVFSGNFRNTLAVNDVVSVVMYSQMDAGDVIVDGVFRKSELTLYRSDDTTIASNEEDIVYSGSFGRSPSRREINDMVAEMTNGAILDGKLPTDRKLLVFDTDDECFLMYYKHQRDTWVFKKLGVR
jgi:hypothetical protein